MKKKLKNLFLIVFVLTVVIHTVPVNALTNSNSFDQNKQKPDLTDEVLETKEFNESLAEYLESVYGENWKELYARNTRSVKKAQEIESKFSKDSFGNPIYPEYIGGIYIGDDDRLVVQIVRNEIPTSKSAEHTLYKDVLSVDNNATIQSVTYSYAKLVSLNEMLENLFLQNKLPSSVTSFYIDVINNKIIVNLLNCNENEIMKFKETITDTPIITFEQEENATVTLNAGAPNGAGGSVGYRARKGSSGQGFVTHGHGMTKESVISGIGIVKEKQFGGNIDASWVNTSGYSATPSNNWHAYPPYTVPTLSLDITVKSSFYVGERVGRIGMASGNRTGKITNASWSGSVAECNTCTPKNFTKMVLTDVYQIPGDSGGIVYYTFEPVSSIPLPPGSTPHMTAGIGVFKTGDNHMIFTRADLINAKFGLSRY